MIRRDRDIVRRNRLRFLQRTPLIEIIRLDTRSNGRLSICYSPTFVLRCVSFYLAHLCRTSGVDGKPFGVCHPCINPQTWRASALSVWHRRLPGFTRNSLLSGYETVLIKNKKKKKNEMSDEIPFRSRERTIIWRTRGLRIKYVILSAHVIRSSTWNNYRSLKDVAEAQQRADIRAQFRGVAVGTSCNNNRMQIGSSLL